MHHVVVQVCGLAARFPFQSETTDRSTLLVRIVRLLFASITAGCVHCNLVLIASLLTTL
jgi:hypothetical protein